MKVKKIEKINGEELHKLFLEFALANYSHLDVEGQSRFLNFEIKIIKFLKVYLPPNKGRKE